MTFVYKTGNILDDESDALINPVNCTGVMGKGLAKQFKLKYPEAFTSYRSACKNGELKIGAIHYCAIDNIEKQKTTYIVHFPTKDHWKSKSKLSFIADGLDALIKTLEKLDVIKSVAIPSLGCGLGGLEWNEVKVLIEEKLKTLKNIEFIIYTPN